AHAAPVGLVQMGRRKKGPGAAAQEERAIQKDTAAQKKATEKTATTEKKETTEKKGGRDS
nr:hypothetical protein [Streptomyces sp. DSM 41633]